MSEQRVGRPRFQITEDVCDRAESLAAQGLNQKEIALSLGICYDTLREKKRQYSVFSAAIQAGEAKGLAVATNALFQKVKAGDVAAIKYYLNNRGIEWAERRETEVKGKLAMTHEESLAHLR